MTTYSDAFLVDMVRHRLRDSPLLYLHETEDGPVVAIVMSPDHYDALSSWPPERQATNLAMQHDHVVGDGT